VNAGPDLGPRFPLPARGDRVRVPVTGTSRTAPDLLVARDELTWCRVVQVLTGPYDLFPVNVRLPSGRVGAYQQHEIRGWQPSPARRVRAWLRGV
jgi:hypothetical protein